MLIFLTPRFQRGLFWHSSVYAKFDERLFGFSKVSLSVAAVLLGVVVVSYIEVARALENVKCNAVIDGQLVAIDKNGVSHFQLLQNALRHEATLLYCAFDLMFHDGEDLRELALLERKKRLKSILPRHKLIAFSRHRKTFGTKFFEQAERKGLEGIIAKRSESKYLGRPHGQLAKDQGLETSGSRHCWVYCAEEDEAILQSTLIATAGAASVECGTIGC